MGVCVYAEVTIFGELMESMPRSCFNGWFSTIVNRRLGRKVLAFPAVDTEERLHPLSPLTASTERNKEPLLAAVGKERSAVAGGFDELS